MWARHMAVIGKSYPLPTGNNEVSAEVTKRRGGYGKAAAVGAVGAADFEKRPDAQRSY